MYTNMFEKEPGIDVRVCMISSGVVTTNDKKIMIVSVKDKNCSPFGFKRGWSFSNKTKILAEY